MDLGTLTPLQMGTLEPAEPEEMEFIEHIQLVERHPLDQEEVSKPHTGRVESFDALNIHHTADKEAEDDEKREESLEMLNQNILNPDEEVGEAFISCSSE